jgi:hypothetical protein
MCPAHVPQGYLHVTDGDTRADLDADLVVKLCLSFGIVLPALRQPVSVRLTSDQVASELFQAEGRLDTAGSDCDACTECSSCNGGGWLGAGVMR